MGSRWFAGRHSCCNYQPRSGLLSSARFRDCWIFLLHNIASSVVYYFFDCQAANVLSEVAILKVALIFFSFLTSLSLSFPTQETQPIVCRGKPLSITLIPGPEMTVTVMVPLRFGGTRPPPLPWVNTFPSENKLRLVIKNREEFSDYWKRLTSRVSPHRWVPPMPEIDFSKETIVVSAMGMRPSSGYGTIIDGVCEVDGQVEVFISNVEDPCRGMQLQIITAPADAVRIPRTDLPIVFRETEIGCQEAQDLLKRSIRVPG
jgi:hypothetical protein